MEADELFVETRKFQESLLRKGSAEIKDTFCTLLLVDEHFGARSDQDIRVVDACHQREEGVQAGGIPMWVEIWG